MKRASFNIRQEGGKLLPKQGYIFHLPYPKRPLFAVAQEGNNINSSIRWVVSEMSSGYAVAFGKWDGTRRAVVIKAKTTLHKVGAQYLKQQVALVVGQFGKAN